MDFAKRTVALTKDPDQVALRERRWDGLKRTDADFARDRRREAQRDLDRAIYIEAWRRLGAITQIVTPPDGMPTFHTRLTHSQKVAQVSRSIAQNVLEAAEKSPNDMEAIANFGGYDADVCEGAGILHDIGHPPFGHIGEEVLRKYADEVLGLPDGFEGNAQTIRILTKGKLISYAHEGADLTAAVIAALAKYPWLRADEASPENATVGEKFGKEKRGKERESLKPEAPFAVPKRPVSGMSTPLNRVKERKKYSFYDSEIHLLPWCREFSGVDERQQTLEAATMDVADDITYAVHDLEDFLYAGRLSVTRIHTELLNFHKKASTGYISSLREEGDPYLKLQAELDESYGIYDAQAFVDAAGRLTDENGFLTRLLESSLGPRDGETQGAQRRLFSHKIGELINAVTFKPTAYWTDGPFISLQSSSWHEVQILKSIARRHIIDSPDIALLQRGQEKILWAVCEDLTEWVNNDPDRLPTYLADELAILESQDSTETCNQPDVQEDQSQLPKVEAISYAPRGSTGRIILDYICTLSDNQCIALYKKLRGGEVHQGGIVEVF